MITDFIDSVVIIDDKKDEIEELQKVLEEEDIYVKFQLIDENWNNNITQLKKQKQLIFMDLSLDDSIDIKRNVSERIRPILKKIIPQKYGCYGMVVWTKHIKDVDILKEMLSKDWDKYKLPMFIIALDKLDYISNNYKNILSDLNAELEKDKIAYFFINWINTVKIAANKAIYDIYSLIPDYNKQQTELLYLIYKMSLSHTGIHKENTSDYNLTIDAYKAFDELLYSDLIHQLNKNNCLDMFNKEPQNPWSKQQDESNKIASKINSKLFIDSVNLDQNIILPGNVYEILNSDKLENQPDGTKTIAIELTPPCDFSQNKKISSRIIKGFIWDMKDKTKFKKDFYYKDMHPLEIDGIANSQLLLDFRYIESIDNRELQDTNKYKLLFRVTHKLFADILQKFSSSYARLGLPKLDL